MSIFWKRHSRLIGADSHSIVWTEVADTAARLALSLTSNDDGKVVVQLDNDTVWLIKDYSGPSFIELTGGAGGGGTVTSVFARIGDVLATAGDYTAAEITNVANGNLEAVTVQAAIDELDTEKAPATHTHVLSQVTDSGTAAAQDVGVTVGDVPQLEDIGGGTPGLPAVDGSQLTGVTGGGSAITVEDDGTPLTTDVTLLNFAGAGVTVTEPVADEITVTIAPGAAPIDTVFSRTGTVVAEASDYDASQVDNDSSVTGAFVDDALNTLDTDKAEATDARFPTTDEKGALAGTGTPSGSNLYVTADTLAAKTHTLSEITDAGTAAGEDTGTTNGTVPLHTADGELTLNDGTGNTAYLEAYGVYPGNTSNDPFDFGGSTQTTPRLTRFAGTRSNADSVDAGNVIVRGGTAAGTNSTGGDIEIYGGVGTTGDGDLRLGGYDNAGTDVPLGGDVRILKGFTIAETASAPYTTAAGRGQLWPRTSDGALMWTDSSDVDHDLTTGGSGTMAIEDEGTPVTGGPHDTMNFVGSGVTAADAGGGEVTITIAAGSAPIDTVFGRTGTVVAVAGDYTASEVTNVPAGDIAATTVQAAIDELDTDKAAVGHTQVYTTVDGVPTDTFLGRDSAGTGATEAMNLTVARTLLNVEDGSVAAGTSGDAYATSHETDSTAHTAADLVNVPAGDIVATTVQAAINELDTAKSATTHTHTLIDVTDAGTAAAENVGTTIGDVVQLVNVGGNAGLPTVDGSQLTGIDAGVDTFLELTDVGEPDYVGHAGEFVKVNAGASGLEFDTIPGGGDMLSTNNLSDVTNAVTATQNLSVEVGVDVAAFGHTHDVLSNIDNTAGNGVILGRDTAGIGDSEELTPAGARAVIGVALGNIGAGTHNDLELAVADSGAIFADLQNGQIAGLTEKAAPVAADVLLLEDSAASNAKKYAEVGNLPFATALNELTDVTLTTPATDSVLIKSAGDWIDGTLNTDGITDDAVTLAKIDAHTGAVAGVLGYGASGVPTEISSSATTGHVLKGAGTGAPPVFGQLVADSYGTGTIAVTRLADGTDGELITWSTAGVATTVAAGADGHVLTSKGAGAVPVFEAAPATPTLTKSITVEDPVSGETISMFYTNVAITVTQITAVIVGSTSVTFNISHGTSRAAVTNDVMSADDVADSTTTGNITTSFGGGDPTIPADSFVALTTSAASGTPTELHVTVEYTED